jgi:phosphohistidine phosphatase
MHLYLMQHGLALSNEADPERPLSDQGRAETLRVARAGARGGIRVDEIWHSTKLRAKQTAEILAQHLQPSGGLVELDGLAPMDDPEPMAARLAREDITILVTGHLPFLERLADLLLPGGGRGAVRFTNSALVGLERTPSGYRVSLIVPPDFVQERPWVTGES